VHKHKSYVVKKILFFHFITHDKKNIETKSSQTREENINPHVFTCYFYFHEYSVYVSACINSYIYSDYQLYAIIVLTYRFLVYDQVYTKIENSRVYIWYVKGYCHQTISMLLS
jgi:hypothetical protein